LTCKQISPRAGDYGEVRWDAVVTKQDGSIAANYDVLTMVAKRWPLEGES
jgi:oxepin-CoA hydrolase/3-oxo-5,6-dehydrosuberyl-CoA semialdehyde dehydrogenase